MWFIVLIVLAIAAFFIIKALKRRADDQAVASSDASAPGQQSLESRSANTETDTRVEGSSNTAEAGDPATTAADAPEGATPNHAASDIGAANPDSGARDASSPAVASDVNSVGPEGSATGAVVSLSQLKSGDTLRDVREMIKVLNLRNSDASRLDIDKSQFDSLWAGKASTLSADELDALAGRLRRMLA